MVATRLAIHAEPATTPNVSLIYPGMCPQCHPVYIKKGTMMKLSLQSSLIVLTVVMIVVSGASQVSAAIPTSERNALIDLYNSTDGANWVHNANWLGAPGTECTWERVYCNFE